MTDVKHTPGPWFVNQDEDGNYRSIGSAGWWGLAQVVVRFEGERNDDATGLANANLIAAAPDLLAALKAFVADFDASVSDPDATTDAARAAIAKAEGRS